MGINENNLQQIELTNQRGGRILSIVDLIKAKTISTEAAAFCRAALKAGCSFFTGAVPGGAGKTTLMAALLGMLPADEKIITASDDNHHGVIPHIRVARSNDGTGHIARQHIFGNIA